MNDEKEGREKLHESIIEENEQYPIKYRTLDFLKDKMPKSNKGEYVAINILQLAKRNLKKINRYKFRKRTKRIILSNDFGKNINNEIKENKTEKNIYESTLNTKLTDIDNNYDGFVNRVMKRLSKENLINMREVNNIRKEIPHNNEDYFNILMRQKKKNKKLVLSSTYHSLKKIYSLEKNINTNSSNSTLLPFIKKEKINSNFGISRNSSTLKNNNSNNNRIINLFEQVSNNNFKSNKKENNYNLLTERRNGGRRNLSIPSPIKLLRKFLKENT